MATILTQLSMILETYLSPLQCKGMFSRLRDSMSKMQSQGLWCFEVFPLQISLISSNFISLSSHVTSFTSCHLIVKLLCLHFYPTFVLCICDIFEILMKIRERTSHKQYLFPVQSFLAIEPILNIQVIVAMTSYLMT